MKDWMQAFTTVVVLAGFVGLTGYVVYIVVPLIPVERLVEMLMLMVGALIGYAGAGVQYWLGSSEGSSRKTELMNQVNQVNPIKTEVSQ